MVLLFALTDHLGITASSLSVVETLLVALQASDISTGIVPDNFFERHLMVWAISLHFSTFWREKTWTVWSQPV